MRVLSTLVLLVCVACAEEGSPLMAPGRDCVECHDGGEARRWTVAGTWARGAHVSVTDANGKTVPMRGNQVGNFYTAEPLTRPLSVSVDGVAMPADALSSALGYGGCNLCHSGAQTADPELMAPGRDCLACHRAGGVASSSIFTVAGTWPGVTSITISDRGGTGTPVTISITNPVGNFHTAQPFVPPLKFWAGTKLMDKLVDYGGCNACHGRGGDADD
jgi:hypothetical protein